MELPSIENIIDGKVTFDDIRYVDVNDILGREVVRARSRRRHRRGSRDRNRSRI